MKLKGDYPALNVAGKLGDHHTVAKQLFLMPFASNYSQSNEFSGHIESVSKVWQQTGGEMNLFPQAIAVMYQNLFTNYFDSVAVTTESTGNDRTFILNIEYGDGSTSQTINDTIFSDGGIVSLSNNGISTNI